MGPFLIESWLQNINWTFSRLSSFSQQVTSCLFKLETVSVETYAILHWVSGSMPQTVLLSFHCKSLVPNDTTISCLIRSCLETIIQWAMILGWSRGSDSYSVILHQLSQLELTTKLSSFDGNLTHSFLQLIGCHQFHLFHFQKGVVSGGGGGRDLVSPKVQIHEIF